MFLTVQLEKERVEISLWRRDAEWTLERVDDQRTRGVLFAETIEFSERVAS